MLEKVDRRAISEWGVKYHELILGKPEAHLFIDDKAINDLSYFQSSPITGKSFRGRQTNF